MAIFIRVVHFPGLGLLERSIFQQLSGTAKITCVMMTSMFVGHPVSF